MLHWYNEINAHNRNGQGQSIYVLDYEWLVKCPNFGENQLFSTEVQHKTMDTCSHIGLSLFYTPVKTTCSEQKLHHNNRCLVELSIHLLFNVSNILFFFLHHHKFHLLQTRSVSISIIHYMYVLFFLCTTCSCGFQQCTVWTRRLVARQPCIWTGPHMSRIPHAVSLGQVFGLLA